MDAALLAVSQGATELPEALRHALTAPDVSRERPLVLLKLLQLLADERLTPARLASLLLPVATAHSAAHSSQPAGSSRDSS